LVHECIDDFVICTLSNLMMYHFTFLMFSMGLTPEYNSELRSNKVVLPMFNQL
jgi:hypothetical protein